MTELARDLLRDYRPRHVQLWPVLLFWLAWGLLRWQLPPGAAQRALGVAAQLWLAYSLAWWALSAVAARQLAMRGRPLWLIGFALVPAALLGALLGLPLTADFAWHRLALSSALLAQLLPAISLATVLHLLPLAARWREQRRHAAEARRLREAAAVADLSRQVTLAELKTLQAQVEPHFLYNTLAGIQYLVRHNALLADRMLGRLHDYLRLALPAMRAPMSTLAQEFALADAYLALMQMRLGERLSVTLDLPHALASHAFPPLMLGTLIENAVQHGIEPKPGGGHLSVQARGEGGALQVTVSDTGVGLQPQAATAGSGLGLSSVQQRLQLIYGSAASLEVAARPQGGVVATLRVPDALTAEKA